MRRPQSAFGLAAVIASLLVVQATPPPARASVAAPRPGPEAAAPTAEAPSACTDHKSTRVPPDTIRVLRSKRSKTPKRVAGTVEEVDFRTYVGVVMAAEWPAHYPLETLKAGAIAVKQYGWFYTRLYRGRTVTIEGEPVCYDVTDDTNDQVYYPEGVNVKAKIHKAVNSTWDITLRKYKTSSKSSTFFLTGYRAGTSGRCGAEVTGFKLYQRGARHCGELGYTFRRILTTYLNPRLEIVQHGDHDIIGSRHGDAAALVRQGDKLVAHVWTPGVPPPEPGSNAGASIATTDLVGAIGSDVDRDGLDDLVWVRQTGARSGRLRVALSEGTDYGSAATWHDGQLGVPLSSARLLAGDFDADGRRDIALLGRGEGEAGAALFVLRRKKGTRFATAARWWSGALDLSTVRGAWAGDVTGDGYADLIVRQETATGGVRIRVAKNQLGSGLGTLKKRFVSSSLESAATKMTPADANRDGRTDLFMLLGRDGPTRIQRLQGQPGGGFKRVHIWTAPGHDPIPVDRTRIGTADVDYDGFSDLVLFTRSGGGTRIRVLSTRYTSMKPGPDSEHGSLDWGSLRPY